MSSSGTSTEKQAADERLRTEFNDWAKAGRGEGMEKGHRPTGEQAIALMKLSKDARVLDVGCGSGWATRLMAEQAPDGSAIGIDISDEMVRLAQETTSASNVTFQVASAELLPFGDDEFSDAFSMESLYYYQDMLSALREIKRLLRPGGQFVSVVDLYQENLPSHQWISQLKVPVQLLSTAEYRALLESAGFKNVSDQRVFDPTPIPDDYQGGSFETREDLVNYRNAGSLVLRGEA